MGKETQSGIIQFTRYGTNKQAYIQRHTAGQGGGNTEQSSCQIVEP